MQVIFVSISVMYNKVKNKQWQDTGQEKTRFCAGKDIPQKISALGSDLKLCVLEQDSL